MSESHEDFVARRVFCKEARNLVHERKLNGQVTCLGFRVVAQLVVRDCLREEHPATGRGSGDARRDKRGAEGLGVEPLRELSAG